MSMDIFSKEGAKVKGIFLNGELANGYDHDRIEAAKYIKQRRTYTVQKTDASSFHTSVYLKEFPGIPFNSVLFDNA